MSEEYGYDFSPGELRTEPNYDSAECPDCGFTYNPEWGCSCGYDDDYFPICPTCGGAIAEDGQCQDCLLYYPEHDQERG